MKNLLKNFWKFYNNNSICIILNTNKLLLFYYCYFIFSRWFWTHKEQIMGVKKGIQKHTPTLREARSIFIRSLKKFLRTFLNFTAHNFHLCIVKTTDWALILYETGCFYSHEVEYQHLDLFQFLKLLFLPPRIWDEQLKCKSKINI